MGVPCLPTGAPQWRAPIQLRPGNATGMDIERVRSLLGTNIWADFPVAEVWLDLSGIAEGEIDGPVPAGQVPGARPAARPAGCRGWTAGRTAPALELWLARTFARLTLTLGAHLGGDDDGFLRIAARLGPAGAGHGRLCPTARSWSRGPAPRRPWRCSRRSAPMRPSICLPPWRGLRAAADLARPTPTAAALAAAARARAIPVRHLGSGLLQLGYGARQVRTLNTCSEGLGVVAQWVTGERDLMEDLLASVGIACTEAPVDRPPLPGAGGRGPGRRHHPLGAPERGGGPGAG